MIVDLFLVLIFLLLVGFGVLSFLAWQKISIFLTYNTRYQSAEYEKAITSLKTSKPSSPASKTEVRGRQIKPVDDLIDIAEVDFEVGYKAIAELGEQ